MNDINRDFSGNLAVGLYDVPDSAEAEVLYLNLLTANAVVFGGSMSGKTTFVKNVLARMHEEEPYASRDRIYILDFGGNLMQYGGLGRVCAYFDHSNDENVKRIFRTVEELFQENNRLLNGENYLSALRNHPETCPLHVTLIMENANAFFSEERYGGYYDLFLKLARDGLSKGVSILMTASDLTGMMSRSMVYFTAKFALEMPQEKYFDVFSAKVDVPMKLPGRGITTLGGKPYEFQTFLPFAEAEETRKLNALIRSSADPVLEKIRSFPPELTADDILTFCPEAEKITERYDITAGLDYYTHTPVCWNPEEAHCAAIYGKKQFGKTNLLRRLLDGVCERYPDAGFVFFDDGREQLREFALRYGEQMGRRVQYTLRFEEFEFFHGELYQFPPLSPTFFVIQNKQIFLRNRLSEEGIPMSGFYLAESMGGAENRRFRFLFSDVPKIAQKDVYDTFNIQLKAAFLLDNIADFVISKGKSSVFETMDPVELKYEYARCDIGDGYFYDIDRDDLRKVKFIKTDPAV